MTTYFLDSSTLVKNYVTETGTVWVVSIIEPESGNTIAIAHITIAEVAAGLSAKLRGQLISADEFEIAVRNLLRDAAERFSIVPIDQEVIQRAVDVIRRHTLRGYDAVQLACGLVLSDMLTSAEEPSPIFVTADKSLRAAAQAEGLQAEDPNLHNP